MANMFSGFSESEIRSLMHRLDASSVELKRGQNLLDLIPRGRLLGIVESGQINILKTDSAGNHMMLFSAGPSSVFGPYYTRDTRGEISIVAVRPSRVTVIDYRLFLAEGTDDPLFNRFNKDLIEMLINTDRAMNERMAVLMQKSIRTKLLEFFRQEARKSGTRTFDMPFTFTFLADWLSVDRSAMQREMKNLKDEGFISIRGKTVTVLEGTDSSVYNKF